MDYRRGESGVGPIKGAAGERVSCFKFLGISLLEGFTWDMHTEEVVKKSQQHLFYLKRLRKFGIVSVHSTGAQLHPEWMHILFKWELHYSQPQNNTKGGEDISEDQQLWASLYIGHLLAFFHTHLWLGSCCMAQHLGSAWPWWQ